MKSNISGSNGFGLLANHHVASAPPNAVMNIPPMKVSITNNSAAMIHPTANQRNALPITCHPL